MASPNSDTLFKCPKCGYEYEAMTPEEQVYCTGVRPGSNVRHGLTAMVKKGK